MSLIKTSKLINTQNDCLTGESIAMQVCTKGTSKLKFLHRKNRFLCKDLKMLFCNALLQPHFDYACAAWHPDLNEKYRNKLEVLQNISAYNWTESTSELKNGSK